MTWPNLHTQVRDEAAGSSHGQSQVVRHCPLELRAEPLSRSTHLGVGLTLRNTDFYRNGVMCGVRPQQSTEGLLSSDGHMEGEITGFLVAADALVPLQRLLLARNEGRGLLLVYQTGV